MKVLTCLEPHEFAYSEVTVPELLRGNTLLKIKRIGICGTDIHAYEGTQPFFTYPRILGHELAGEIIETIDAEGFQQGENVTIIPYFNCGHCIACRNHTPNCCVTMNVLGVHVNGGMSEYLSVPSYSLVHGEGLSLDELALVEPLAIGAHGIRRAGVQPSEFVLVIGAGPIGLATMAFAAIAGAQVIAMDVNKERLSFCQKQLHIQHTIHAMDADVLQQLKAITNNDMPTVVIDCSGNSKAINHGFQYMAHGARYVLIGLQKGDINFSHPEFHKREATLMSSRNATKDDFNHVIKSMKHGLVNPTTFITHRIRFENLATTFATFSDPASGVIKAMVEMD